VLLRSPLKILPLVFALAAASSAQKQGSGASLRAELAQILQQRYRLTSIGPSFLGLKGRAGPTRQVGGVVEARRTGLYGSLEQNGCPAMNVRGESVGVTRGNKDMAFAVGEQFYVHSVYVGQDVITLGVVTARSIATPSGTGRLWAVANFFFPAESISNADIGAIFGVLDQWLLPVMPRPAVAVAPAPVAPPPPPAPAAAPALRAALQAGMTREEVLAALGAPQREASYGPRVWLTYAGMVVVLENGSLASVDRSSQPPSKVTVRSEPDGADVYLGANFVGSTPATLELPTGIYKVSLRLNGYKDWQREVQVPGGSELTLRAHLEK